MTRARRLARPALSALAWGLVTLGLSWIVLGCWPGLAEGTTPAIAAASFIPYGALTWPLAGALFVLAGRRRSRLLAVGCCVGLLVQASWTQPYWPHPAPEATGAPLRLMSINMNFGKGDAGGLAAQIAVAHPDVIVLVEVQRPLLTALDESGVLTPFPYRLGTAPDGYAVVGEESDQGTFVLSRTPLALLERLNTPNGQYVVRVSRPMGDLTLVAARPRNSLLGASLWSADFAALTASASRHAQSRLVVAGDLSATREHAPLQRLLAVGLRDAAEQAGVGFLPTYPSTPVPLIQIDHVLTGAGVTAVGLTSFGVDGTDHLGLIADLIVQP